MIKQRLPLTAYQESKVFKDLIYLQELLVAAGEKLKENTKEKREEVENKILQQDSLYTLQTLLNDLMFKSTKFKLTDKDLSNIRELDYAQKLFQLEKNRQLENKVSEVVEKEPTHIHDWIFNEEQTEKYCNTGCDNYTVHKIEFQN